MNSINEYYDKTFDNLQSDFEFADKTFEYCKFTNCELSESSFERAFFSDCTFTECSLSLVNVQNTRFNDIIFLLCKISGIDFSKINPFLLKIDFDDCLMSYCSFSSLKLHHSKFTSCKINYCDFIGASLVSADFSKSQFKETIFDNTDLSKADFSDASGYQINPQTNKIKKAVFTMPDAVCLLEPLDIIIK